MTLDRFAPKIAPSARQGAGFALGMKQVGGGGGPVAAMGMVLSLKKQPHMPTGQRGGGIQAARGLKRTLLNQGHMPGQPGYREDGAIVRPHGKFNQQTGGMDSEVALDYYGNNFHPTGKVKNHKYGIYAGMTATEGVIAPEPANQVDVLERAIDDRMAIDYYNHSEEDIHESFTSDVMNHNPVLVEPFEEGDSAAATAAPAGTVQAGAKAADAPAETGVNVATNQALYANFKKGKGPTAGERGLVYGDISPIGAGPHGSRTGAIIYAEDLISIETADQEKVVLEDGSKFLSGVRKDEQSGLKDLLFKLRFKIAGGLTGGKLIPLKFGDGLNLIYQDEAARTVMINHEGDLNVLENNRDTIFELIRKNTTKDDIGNLVSSADEVYIRKSVEGTLKKYLRINPDRRRIETTAVESEATAFKIVPVKGCGPMWRYDSDTRGTNLFNSSQVRDILVARTKRLTDKIAELESSIGKAQQAKEVDEEGM